MVAKAKGTYMFDFGKGFNDLAGKAQQIAKAVDVRNVPAVKSLGSKASEIAGDAVNAAANITTDVAGKVSSTAGWAMDRTKDATASAVDGVQNLAQEAKRGIDGVDLFNSRLRQQAVDEYNNAVERYEKAAEKLSSNTKALYDLRKIAIVHVKYVEQHINQLANTPKEFAVELHKISVEVETFENKENEVREAERQAKVAEGGAGTGATLGALGIAVATMGPTALMGVATTFGVASTGTAISALSGAAANSAALAWLGGGALAAGGGGMSAGSALLALAGPVGWTIAGVAGAAAIGSGIYASNKNKETADKLVGERRNVEEMIRRFNTMNAEVEALTDATQTQIDGVERANAAVTGTDYHLFSKDEKAQAGLLVNVTLTLARLINKELKLDD